jgi:hypothetical protein
MRFKLILMCFLLALSSSVLSGELRVRDYKNVSNDELTLLKVYHMGVGISWANTTFQNHKIYCAPPNLALIDRNYKRILDDELKRGEYSDDIYIGLILLMGLENTFPCK